MRRKDVDGLDFLEGLANDQYAVYLGNGPAVMLLKK
jgi:hypothetical protein